MVTQKFVTAAVIEPFGGFRNVLIVVFWVWGVIGLVLNAGGFLALSRTIGVGQSAYMAATNLFWIGGMILFGVGAAVLPANYRFKRPEQSS